MRLFFALTFSPAARAALHQAQQRLRAFSPGARYPGEETLHLTLAFLGETPQGRAPQLGELLAALPAPPLALRFSQAGPLSPEEGLWALFPEECPALFALQGELAARLEGAGFPLPRRPFRPHVTLARRVAFPGPAPRGQDLLPRPLSVPCGRVSLLRSQLRPQGPLYTELAAQALGVMKNEHANAHLRYYLEREKDPAVIAAMRGAIASLDVG